MTLGNGEVTLVELAAGYAMFAHGGLTCTPHALRDRPAGESRRVFSEEISFLITEVLSDESLRIRAFGAGAPGGGGGDRRLRALGAGAQPRLAGEVEPAVPEVTWLVDGRRIASVAWPYEVSWPLARGRHRLEMVAGGRRSEPVEFEVR